MALVNCPECKKHYSNTQAACPHCGYQEKGGNNTAPVQHQQIVQPAPVAAAQGNKAASVLLIMVCLAIGVILLLGGCAVLGALVGNA